MVLPAIAFIGTLTAVLGGALGWAKSWSRPKGPTLIDTIDLLLPQTQCERCGYPGCRPYAQAVAAGAEINRCPPGGTHTIAALAALLGRDVIPLDPTLVPIDPYGVALIDESRCIGCALCLPACPVDAIVGSAGHMHTVITRQCTGCELCIPACPVDCISMIASSDNPPQESPFTVVAAHAVRASAARRRFVAHTERADERARAAEARRQQRQTRLAERRDWDDA